MNATLLADGWHGGPGPWILLVPLFWISAFVFLRRVVFRRGGRGATAGPGGFAGGFPGRPPWAGSASQAPAPSPIETLNRRYAEGQIDEFEYRDRYDLLNSVINPTAEAGAATDRPEDGKR